MMTPALSRRSLVGILLAAALGSGAQPVVAQSGFGTESLRNRVEAYRASGGFRAAGEPVLATGALPAFYLARDFAPAWLDGQGRWTARADSALAVLDEAASHGLDPQDYHRAASIGSPRRYGRARPTRRPVSMQSCC